MFYTYTQNNSAGVFITDHPEGLSHYVIIEADNAREANYRAERIGLYFDGSLDCPCCGARWSEMWDGEGDLEPLIYGCEVKDDGKLDQSEMRCPITAWINDGPEGYVHYKDGTVKPIYI